MTLVPELGTALRLHHSVGYRHRCVYPNGGGNHPTSRWPCSGPTAPPAQRATQVAQTASLPSSPTPRVANGLLRLPRTYSHTVQSRLTFFHPVKLLSLCATKCPSPTNGTRM